MFFIFQKHVLFVSCCARFKRSRHIVIYGSSQYFFPVSKPDEWISPVRQNPIGISQIIYSDFCANFYSTSKFKLITPEQSICGMILNLIFFFEVNHLQTSELNY